MVALLSVGSAISLLSCENAPKAAEVEDEKIVSRTVRNMEWVKSDNGVRKQLMRAPLREEYEYATPPYEEYTRGIEAIGYDSLGMPNSSVVADYALHWTERDLWELNGNVVVRGEEGQKLYTQQLRWDSKIGKIYSFVDSKVEEGSDVLYGVGFEAADDFSWWTFNGVTGTVGVAVEPTSDSTAVAGPAVPMTSGEDESEAAAAAAAEGAASPGGDGEAEDFRSLDTLIPEQ